MKRFVSFTACLLSIMGMSGGEASAADLKVGDKVLFGKYAGQAVKVDGDELLVMREEDIMGIVE